MIRIGVIGTGNIGRVNTRAMLDTNRVKITCLCNSHIEKAERINREYGLSAALYQNAAEMLQHEKPDAVLICTPQNMHREQFILCAEHGITAFVEKPMAMNPGECRQMMKVQRSTGIKACVCHTQRYRSAIIA